MMSLYRAKGPRTQCSNYHPISLLSVPGKLFTQCHSCLHSATTWQKQKTTAAGSRSRMLHPGHYSCTLPLSCLSCTGCSTHLYMLPTSTLKRHLTLKTGKHYGKCWLKRRHVYKYTGPHTWTIQGHHNSHTHRRWSLWSLLHLPWNETGLHSSSSHIPLIPSTG